ncbi:MAG: MFS transporter [Nitrososphaerales archaeon]
MRSNFAALLFSTVAGDLIAPIFALYLPLYALQLGADPLEIGLVGGVSWASYSFAPYLIGRYSDRVRMRKAFIVVSLVMLTFCSFTYVLVESPVQLIALRLVEGVAWSILWPVMDVAISEDASWESTKALSIYNAVWSTAGAIGPLLGGSLILLFAGSIRDVFLVTALLTAASVVVMVLFFREGSRPAAPVEGPADGAEAPTVEVRRGRRPGRRARDLFWVFVLGMIMISSVRGVLFTFYPPLAQSQGVSIAVIALIGFTFGAGRAVVFVLSTRDEIRGFILDDRNVERVLLAALGLSAIGGVLPLAGDRSGAIGFLAFGVVAFSGSFLVSASQANFISRAEPHKRGAGAGIFESTIGIGLAISPILAGLFSGGSLSLPFLVVPVEFAISVPVFLYLLRRARVPRDPDGGQRR